MKLKILHLDSGAHWRGGQRQVLLLAHGLKERGHDVLIAGSPDSPLIHRAQVAGIPTAEIAMRGDLDIPGAMKLAKLVKSYAPNIMHAHDARSHAVGMLSLLRNREIPLVVTRRVAFRPKSVRMKYGKRVARFIAISNAVKGSMMEAGVPDDRIDVVYSGVPALSYENNKGWSRDWRGERHWPPNAVICGVVGAMTAEKGLDTVAVVAGRLRGDAANRARIVLLGGNETGPVTLGGVDSYRAGFVEEIHGAMAGLDLLWHPSSSEGLGTAVIDAMALGVPPITFATGGLPELIENGVSGVLIPVGDVEAYAASATRLICDADERSRLAAAGPARAAQFGVEKMIESTEKVYYKVVNGV